MAIVASIISSFNEKGFNDAAKSVDRISSKFDQVGKKAGLAFGALAAGGFLAAKAAAEDEKSALTLATTLQNVTGATRDQISANEEYISSLTLATGVADDQLRPSLDRLVRSTGDLTEAQSLQALALDISAGTGKDLQAVSEALAKAHDGNFAALKKLGVPLDESIVKSKDFDAAQKKLADTFKGQSSKAAESTAGKMQRVQNAMNEAQETIGYALLPALEGLTGIFEGLAPWITENKDLVSKLAIGAGVLTGSIWALSMGLKAYNTIMGAVKVATTLWAAAQGALNLTFLANPLTWIIVGIVALVAAIVLAYQKSDTFREIVDKAFGKIREVIGNVVGWIKEKVPAAFQAIVNFVKGIPQTFVNIGKNILNAITTPYRLAFVGIAKLWNNTIGGLEFTLPDWIPVIGGKTFSVPKLPETIPALAEGGIVSKPTLALIGEAGPEAVIPLSQMRNHGGGGIVINVTGTMLDPESVAREIQRVLNRSVARAGGF